MFSNICFGTKCLKKSDKRNFELYQVQSSVLKRLDIHKNIWTILSIHTWFSIIKYFHTSKFNTTHACHSIKFGSIYFFSYSAMKKFHHLLGCHATDINFSLISL